MHLSDIIEKNVVIVYMNIMDQEKSDKRRVALSLFTVYSIILLCVYTLIVNTLHQLNYRYHETFYTTSFVMLVIGTAMFYMVYRMPYSMILFGINLRRWKKYLAESVLYSLLFCALITGIKWWLMHQFPIYQDTHLFHLGRFHVTEDIYSYDFGYIIPIIFYIIFVPVQTFIVHGACQSPVLYFVQSKHSGRLSIILATIFFSSVHAAYSIIFALAVFIPGFLWSLLYYRQRSLLGVSVSHGIVGIWGLYVLGYGEVIKMASAALMLN